MGLGPSVFRVATEAGLGYGLGYMGLIGHPVAAAILAASICVVKEVSKRIFSKDFVFVGTKGTDQWEMLVGAANLAASVVLGGMLADATKLAGMRFAAVPVIQLIAFGILVEYSRHLLAAAYQKLQPYMHQIGSS